MATPSIQKGLLATRLVPPPRQEKQVARERLLAMLDGAASRKLTLLCAPAGYGKTTLLSHWISRRADPAGWLSLEDSDNDISQFLRYFLAAVQQIDPKVGALIPGMLQPPRPLPNLALWTALINELAASDQEFTIILDDYQVVKEQAVHEAVEQLIEHMPGSMHLILASRADPPINLAALRARGQLLEIRAADLCFDAQEARLFYQDSLGLALPAGEIAALVSKTDGWIAGLQIAGIVLRGQPDLHKAVQGFTGSNRHILDYLAVEVIERLPGSIQDFLCQTAILEDLEASLCDAVTGRSDSQRILEQLDRENQFIVPLDGERRWYRYHRLMAEALRRRSESPGNRPQAELHRRASAWYAQQGLAEPAIDHAFKSGDLSRAAELIESSVETVLKRSQVATLLEWLERLPDELVRAHPRLNTAYAWALLLKGGSISAVQARLADTVSPPSAEEAVIRALVAVSTGNARQGFVQSRRALDDLPADRGFLRNIAVEILGMADVLLGDIPSAIQAFKDSVGLALDSGNILFAVASLSNLGGLYLIQGHLKLAESVYQQALEYATTPYGQRLPVASRALLGLSEVAREFDKLEQARRLLEEALLLTKQFSQAGELVIYLSLARVLQAQGDGKTAIDLVQKALAIAIQSTASPIDDRLVDVSLARLWLQQGNLAGAAEWAARRGLKPPGPDGLLAGDHTPAAPYDLREAEWLVYARLLLAQKQADRAMAVLEMLLSEAQKRGRARRLQEIFVLSAIARQEKGEVDVAIDLLKQSLALAEPEGYRRVYIEEGPSMSRLLREAMRRGIQKSYCARLLSPLQGEQQTVENAPGELVEPLSERELEVLKLLAEGCSNREISQRLYISLSTVKGHISSLSGKLLARNRTEAVARARQLGFLGGK